tara:strand:+ start:199 stop:1299 length:1101 start_codon:yes stop_codon:yes gene_type:complete
MVNIIFKITFFVSITLSNNLENCIDLSGKNRSEIELALLKVPKSQENGLNWLILNMPKEDLKDLSSEFLLTNTKLAYEAWNNSPFKNSIPEDIFLDNILPYANLNEKREEWRYGLRSTFSSYIKDAKTISEAVVILNQKIFSKLGVIYSTKRPKADQSPSESIQAGMASCTGLSILLINTCRSLGIPARFVGTPSWYNNSGNHSWVEIWDNGWHYTGAAEPVDNLLNVSWFDHYASKAIKGDQKYGIFAVTWNSSEQFFPMDWLPDVKTYKALDVTDRYNKLKEKSNLASIGFKAINGEGVRSSEKIIINGPESYLFEGKTYDESKDANDCLTIMLPKNKYFTVNINNKSKKIFILNDTIIEFIID